MDFELNAEQMMYRDSIRSFVNKEVIPVAREWEHAGRYPTEIVATMKQLGLFGLLIPEEYGGMDADPYRSPSPSRRSPVAGWGSQASWEAIRCRLG